MRFSAHGALDMFRTFIRCWIAFSIIHGLVFVIRLVLAMPLINVSRPPPAYAEHAARLAGTMLYSARFAVDWGWSALFL